MTRFGIITLEAIEKYLNEEVPLEVTRQVGQIASGKSNTSGSMFQVICRTKNEKKEADKLALKIPYNSYKEFKRVASTLK